MECTLAMVKPDAQAHAKTILAIARLNGFRIVCFKIIHLTPKQVRIFYGEHKERPFFQDLVDHMTSGPVTVFVLKRGLAVSNWRTLIGATDPHKAKPDTIRWRFREGRGGAKNIVHGSDSVSAAEREIAFFFAGMELAGK